MISKSNEVFLYVSDTVIHNLSQGLIDITNLVCRNEDVHITMESPCLASVTYRIQSKLIPLLEHICKSNNYDKKRIKITTGNLIQEPVWPNIEKKLLIEGWFFGKNIKKNVQEKKFNYHFGQFVSNSTWPRLLLGSYLYYNHKEKTFQTYRRDPRDPGHAVDLALDQLMFNCMDPAVLIPVTDFIQTLPIVKETGLAEHPKTNPLVGEDGDAVNKTIMSWYETFFCDIVCETFFTGKTFHLTEKTARPLRCGNPFLLQGPVDFLSNLKKLGFKTFNTFWDESYDKVEGYHRCKMICNIIDTLSKLSTDELNDLYKKMLPVLQHNQERIETLSAKDFDVFF